MDSEAQPLYAISQMRVLTQPEMVYLHVRSQPAPFAELDTVLDPALHSLYVARATAGLTTTGPDIIRYYPTGRTLEEKPAPLFYLEAGIAVEQGTPTVGESQVVTLPRYRCAALLLWGSLAHIEEAYDVLRRGVTAAGLQRTGECREVNYHFESVDSPLNLLGLYMGVR